MKNKACCVIGTGFLGSQITGELLRLGMNVKVYDQDISNLNELKVKLQEKKLELISKELSARDACWGNVTVSDNLIEAICGVDFIFEAIIENPDVKKWLFQKITHNCGSQVIVCSNTLTVDLNEMASESLFKERIMGCRFLTPVYCIPLVEITIPTFTAQHIVQQLQDFFKSLGIDVLHKIKGNPKRLTKDEVNHYWNVQRNRVRTLNLVVNVQTHTTNPYRGEGTQETATSLLKTEYALRPNAAPTHDITTHEVIHAVTTMSADSSPSAVVSTVVATHVHEMLTSSTSRNHVVGVQEQQSINAALAHHTPVLATYRPLKDDLVSSHHQQMQGEINEVTGRMKSVSIDSKEDCVVCNERNYDSVLIPCGHMWLCYQCACTLKKTNQNCPACRQYISSVIRVYKP